MNISTRKYHIKRKLYLHHDKGSIKNYLLIIFFFPKFILPGCQTCCWGWWPRRWFPNSTRPDSCERWAEVSKRTVPVPIVKVFYCPIARAQNQDFGYRLCGLTDKINILLILKEEKKVKSATTTTFEQCCGAGSFLAGSGLFQSILLRLSAETSMFKKKPMFIFLNAVDGRTVRPAWR